MVTPPTMTPHRLLGDRAAQDAKVAISRLESALHDITAVIGVDHDAAKTLSDALRMVRVAEAKIAILLKRIP